MTEEDISHTPDEVDAMVVRATRIVAFMSRMAVDIRRAAEAETWVRAAWIEEHYGVPKRWCYHRKEQLGAVSKGHRTLLFPLSNVMSMLGSPGTPSTMDKGYTEERPKYQTGES